MGVSIGQGFQSMLGVGNNLARNNNLISETNAKTTNSLRLYSNAATAAEDNLARFTQSVNNQRMMDAGGKTLNANTVNFLRGSDRAQVGNFASQIDDAQSMGHARAMQAASGVGGNVTDTVNTATALRASIAKSTADQAIKSNAQNYSAEQANVMSRMVGSIDSSIILDNLDYNKSVAQKSPQLKVFAAALQGFFPANTDALGNAGKAVSDWSTSAYNKWQAGRNSALDTKTGNATYNPNASPSSNTGAATYQYDPNGTDMVDKSYSFSFNYSGGSDGYGGDSYDFGSF